MNNNLKNENIVDGAKILGKVSSYFPYAKTYFGKSQNSYSERISEELSSGILRSLYITSDVST